MLRSPQITSHYSDVGAAALKQNVLMIEGKISNNKNMIAGFQNVVKKYALKDEQDS